MRWSRRLGLVMSALSLAAAGCSSAVIEADGTELEQDTQGLFSGGTVRVYKDPDFTGLSYAFRVGTDTFLAKDELSDVSLHDNISSARLTNVPKEASVYFFQDQGEGDYVRMRGADFGVVEVANFRDFGMTDRTSSIWVADHGTGSLRIPRRQIETALNNTLRELLVTVSEELKVSGTLKWRPIEVAVRPQDDRLDIVVSANLEIPVIRNKTVSIDLQVRPEFPPGNRVRLVYVGYERHVEHCSVSGPICDAVKAALDKLGNSDPAIQAALDLSVNLVVSPFFRLLSSVPCLNGGDVRPVRANLAPEFVEVVVADNDADLSCLNNRIVPLLPAGVRELVSTEANRRVTFGDGRFLPAGAQ